MATTTKKKVAAKASRYDELKKMLEDRRRELLNSVHDKIRDARAEGNKDRDVLDQGESSEVDIQEDITERRKSEKKITWLAHHDPLTGAANRACFMMLSATVWIVVGWCLPWRSTTGQIKSSSLS